MKNNMIQIKWYMYMNENYENKITIKGYCKSEDTWFDIVEFDVLKNDWKI